MSIRFLAFGALISSIMFTTQVGAVTKENKPPNMAPCTAIIKSSADAAEKADWIVEANLDDAMTPSTDQNQLFLTLSDMVDVKGGWPGKRGATGLVLVGQCFPGGKSTFEGPAGKRLFGQRIRLFGSKHLDAPLRRVFYIEPVSAIMAALPPSPPPDRGAVSDFSTCAKPLWPMESLKQQQTGTVTFRFLIAVDGQVADGVIMKSSGHPLLDEATLEAVKKCKFNPGIKNGKPMAAWMSMQYVWTLE